MLKKHPWQKPRSPEELPSTGGAGPVLGAGGQIKAQHSAVGSADVHGNRFGWST